MRTHTFSASKHNEVILLFLYLVCSCGYKYTSYSQIIFIQVSFHDRAEKCTQVSKSQCYNPSPALLIWTTVFPRAWPFSTFSKAWGTWEKPKASSTTARIWWRADKGRLSRGHTSLVSQLLWITTAALDAISFTDKDDLPQPRMGSSNNTTESDFKCSFTSSF